MGDWNAQLRSRESRKRFCEWFWTGDNGNRLIKDLNKVSAESPRPEGGREFISRDNENGRPYTYGVLLKHWKIHDADRHIMRKWRFIKIGLTRVNTTEGTCNRMKRIEMDIKRIYKGDHVAKTLFCLPIDPMDSRIQTEVEGKVRSSFGKPVGRRLARKLKFPVHTEWLITTQPYIDKFAEKKEEAVLSFEANTAVILNYKFRRNGKELPTGLEMDSGKVTLDGVSPFLLTSASFREN